MQIRQQFRLNERSMKFNNVRFAFPKHEIIPETPLHGPAYTWSDCEQKIAELEKEEWLRAMQKSGERKHTILERFFQSKGRPKNKSLWQKEFIHRPVWIITNSRSTANSAALESLKRGILSCWSYVKLPKTEQKSDAILGGWPDCVIRVSKWLRVVTYELISNARPFESPEKIFVNIDELFWWRLTTRQWRADE